MYLNTIIIKPKCLITLNTSEVVFTKSCCVLPCSISFLVFVYKAERETQSQPVTKETDEELLYTDEELLYTHTAYTYTALLCFLSLALTLARTLCWVAHAHRRCGYDNSSPLPPNTPSSVSKSLGVCLSMSLHLSRKMCDCDRDRCTRTIVHQQTMMSSIWNHKGMFVDWVHTAKGDYWKRLVQETWC